MARDNKPYKKKFTRRDFVVGSGTILAGGALTVTAPKALDAAPATAKPDYPLSKGYLIYDSRHCAGCQSCILPCSLVHDGEASTSRSRIQVTRNVLAQYPV